MTPEILRGVFEVILAASRWARLAHWNAELARLCAVGKRYPRAHHHTEVFRQNAILVSSHGTMQAWKRWPFAAELLEGA